MLAHMPYYRNPFLVIVCTVDFVVGFGGEVTESTVTSVCYETEGKEGRKQRVIVTKVK